jgi:hypothetical protein
MTYDYHYALIDQLSKLIADGWELAGYAGHNFQHEPVLFVKRPARGVNYKPTRKVHRNAVRRLDIAAGLVWRG